jgi:thiol-disulfide isomerase/thioredoxin
MFRSLAAALTLFLAVPALPADDDKPEPKPKPQDVLRELQSEYAKERNAIIREVQAADKAEQGKIYTAKLKVLNETYVPKFLELAQANLDQDFGYSALVFVFQNGGPQRSPEALNLILQNYEKKVVANPIILERAGPRGEKALRDLMAKYADGDGAIKLSFSLANMLYGQAEHAPENKAQLAEAEKLFSVVATKAKAGSREFDMAKGFLHEIRNLQIGKTIPDLESEDLDGNKVKLSDYRGKVVVLDVWATWCGPCREMIPHERELVKKLDGKPFVLVSVSCDDKKETLIDFLENKEKMPWKHWWDGRGGPVTKGLNLRYYPTIYVLDAKGTIRFKGVRGEKMTEAVEKLLKEIDTVAVQQK